MIHPKQHYLDLFQVGESQLDTLVAEALRHGGDYCDLFFENTTYGNLTLRDGIVNAAGRHIDYGVGIRVLCGEKTGYAYAESTALPDMLASARAAAAIADGTSAFYEHSVQADAAWSGDASAASPIPPPTAIPSGSTGAARTQPRSFPSCRSWKAPSRRGTAASSRSSRHWCGRSRTS